MRKGGKNDEIADFVETQRLSGSLLSGLCTDGALYESYLLHSETLLNP